YFASLKSKQRTNVRRRRKQIEERCGPLAVANLESWEEIRSEFPFFREMHDQYWLSRGQGGHFVDLVNGEDFSLDLIRTAAEDGRVCLQKMTAGGETVAYQFLFFFGTRVHWRLTARAIGEEWDKLGVGVLALLFLIENSIERGMKSIEAGPGIYEYKTQMGAEYLQMRSMLIGKPNSPGLQSKIKMLSWIYKSIDVVYYKIWYQRVVKVLGMNRGSIWQYYLRCRL
ncbi:MAG: GNAT family N-acetyltransferase, partial [Candidatus Omnitrophica bacterium]|nr:GNAT family N-acetyltransferase [Candidatus Omnitrophota bacterium]